MAGEDFQKVVPISLEKEMQKSYLDYAMSVIVSRALPDCRDGLKPVHRRILYAMHENKNYYDKPYKKSARVVGDVMGKYHPHGDSAIYSALVRMAQDFSLRIPLVDGQGNFGSMDGDSPAQMRYTEVRLAKVSNSIITDIELGTVTFQDNYDGAEQEPRVLPARFPNLLINGANGIAVGMATSIPTHNLGEVINACCAYIDNADVTLEELLEYIPAPDFPTGGIIIGAGRVKKALATGRGTIILRAKTHFEDINNKKAIIITEIPYQVNKAELIKKIEHLVRDKAIEGISDIRDETNKLGVRVVIELKKDTYPEIILNQLFKYTSMQTTVGINMLALKHGKPELMNIRCIISNFIDFRKEVVTKRTVFLLNKTRKQAHLLIGLRIAVANIDKVIKIIKSAKDVAEAKYNLMDIGWDAEDVLPLIQLIEDYRNELKNSECYLTEEQAKAILEMRLQKLTGLEKVKIEEELAELAKQIKNYLDILGSESRLLSVIKSELLDVNRQFATPRLTQIEQAESDVDIEDLIQKEEMVVTTTANGYIKRVPLATYRAQRRGGKGRSAFNIHEDDITQDILVTNTHSKILFFSNLGRVYQSKVYKIPLGSPQSKGRAIINMLPLDKNEKITNILPLPENIDFEKTYIVFATAAGKARRNRLTDFANIQSNGKIAIKLDASDSLIGVTICNADDHIMLATQGGKAIRFPIDALRVFKGRNSDGVRAIRLADEDRVISISVLKESLELDNLYSKFANLPSEIKSSLLSHKVETQDVQTELDEVGLTSEEAIEIADSEKYIVCITAKGYGKRTLNQEYRITNRGGQGITNINISSKNGEVVHSFVSYNKDQIMLMTDKGNVIRINVKSIRSTGRNTMGVKVMNLAQNEQIRAVSIIHDHEDQEEILETELNEE